MIAVNKLLKNAAMYLRISRDDGDKPESDSIKNQRDLLQSYISKNTSLTLVDEYVDDGYSGTNFERPSFQRMLSDARTGKINCVVVKDLSRLGRNYIDTGRFIEQVFPSMGIRLIAVNDNYDSAEKENTQNQIVVPFKNLINDAYCRDISIKIRSHFDVKRRSGQFIGSFASYGYNKDPENKNHLVIDEYAANIVTKIFDLKLCGYGPERIAELLTELGVQPPYEYKRKCGLNFNSGFRSAEGAKWNAETVIRILKNGIYTGQIIQGKTRRINYKVKKNIQIDESSWIRVDNMHEPIIPKDKFEQVQALMNLDTRTSPNNDYVYPLCGFVKCGSCGQNMVRRSSVRGNKKYFYYHCSTSKDGGKCTSHMINCNKVEEAVLTAIQKQIVLLDKASPILEYIDDFPRERLCIKKIDQQLEKLKSEIEYYGILKAKLYKDMVDGVVTRGEYPNLQKRFEKSCKETEAIFNSITERKNKLINGTIKFQPWIENFQKYRNVTELSRSMVVTLIDKIVVFDQSRIEVNFVFEDELNELIALTEKEEGAEEL